MTARNHIPVNRDDAEIIPPDLGVEIRSLGRAPGRASTALPGNLNHAAVNVGRAVSERPDPLGHQFADQSRSLVIPINLGGIRGAITARFIDFRPFNHAGRTSRVCQK